MARKLSLVPSSPPSPLVRLVDDYLADCIARGLSPRSVKFSIGWPLTRVFLPWCADNDIRSIDQLDQRVCNQFSAHLQTHGGVEGKPLAKASIWSYAKCVRRLIAWAKDQGEPVTGTVKLPKLGRKLVEVLSPQEIDRLENAAVSERDKIIIRLMADTGIRRGELVALTVKSLKTENGKHFIKIRGKGDRERLAGITPAMARRLRRYIDGRPAEADTDRVFLSLRQRDGTVAPLDESGVSQMISAVGERAKIGRRVYPHMLRHSFATIALRRQMNPLQVAEVMGHSSLQMLERTYSHTSPSDAHAALMRMLTTTD